MGRTCWELMVTPAFVKHVLWVGLKNSVTKSGLSLLGTCYVGEWSDVQNENVGPHAKKF